MNEINNKWIEPKFKKSERYYYDVLNNVIYGQKKYSYNYWHEYRHYLLSCRPKFQEAKIRVLQFTQFMLTSSVITFILFFIFSRKMELFFIISAIYMSMLIFPATFMLMQEIDADIYAFRKKYLKRSF